MIAKASVPLRKQPSHRHCARDRQRKLIAKIDEAPGRIEEGTVSSQ